VIVNLDAFRFSANPESHSDSQLRSLQARVNPIADVLLPSMMDLEGPFEYGMAGKVKVVRSGGQPYVAIPLVINGLGTRLQSKGQARRQEIIALLWAQFGQSLAGSFGQRLSGESDVSGLLLRVSFDEQRYLFSVSSHLETKTEMQCQGGYVQRSAYNACARQKTEVYTDASGITHTRNAGCEGGYTMQSVYEPCVRKVPVTETRRVLDPTAAAGPGKATVTFVLSRDIFGSTSLPLADVSYEMTDASGKIIESQGM
jgi:hypothetical protein